MIGFCVFVCLSSLFLFEGNLTLINCVWRAHLYVFLPACTVYDCVCVCFHMCLWLWVFLEWRRNVLTGSVSGGGQWRFWDRYKRRVSGRGREKEGLFHVTLHSTKAQAGRGTRRDMRPPSSLPLPLPHHTRSPIHSSPSSLHPSLQPATLTFIKEPHAGIPLQHLCLGGRGTDTDTHTHAYTAQSHIKVHMHCRKPICFEYCKTVEGPSLFLTKEAALETMSHWDMDTCLHTHSLLLLVSLLYLLSLCPIHLTFH